MPSSAVICGQCGERNAPDAQFCQSCKAFLEWEGEEAQQPQPLPVAQPAAAGPGPAQPAEAVQRPTYRPSDATDDRPLSPGDLICGNCGAGNPPTRQFCRRCAANLVEAEVVRTPWWRRLLPKRGKGRGNRHRGQSRRRIRRSGERPSRRRSPVRAALAGILRVVRWAVVLLLVLGVAGYVFVPSARSSVNSAASTVWHKGKSVVSSDYVPVRPTRIVSNGELPDHQPALAIDTLNTTYWAAADGGPEPTLVLTFERPAQIRRAIIHNGAGPNFQNSHRARQLHLVFSTGHTADVTLVDSPDPQTLDIPGGASATSVEIHVMDQYHAVQGHDLAITEIELFEKRS